MASRADQPKRSAVARRRRRTDPAYRARRNEAVARWKRKPGSAQKILAWYLKRTYGLSTEQYAAMLALQGNRCGICGSFSSGVMTKGGHARWHVDHDHTTGRVRGLLCGPCNVGLGGFKDNPVALRNAAIYLEANSGNK